MTLVPSQTLNLGLMYLTSEYGSLLVQRVLAEYVETHDPVQVDIILGSAPHSTRLCHSGFKT